VAPGGKRSAVLTMAWHAPDQRAGPGLAAVRARPDRDLPRPLRAPVADSTSATRPPRRPCAVPRVGVGDGTALLGLSLERDERALLPDPELAQGLLTGVEVEHEHGELLEPRISREPIHDRLLRLARRSPGRACASATTRTSEHGRLRSSTRRSSVRTWLIENPSLRARRTKFRRSRWSTRYSRYPPSLRAGAGNSPTRS
jgi:hypothetical protein